MNLSHVRAVTSRIAAVGVKTGLALAGNGPPGRCSDGWQRFLQVGESCDIQSSSKSDSFDI